MAFVKSRSVKIVKSNRILGGTSFIWNEITIFFYAAWRRGTNVASPDIPSEIAKKKDILPRIFPKVSSWRVTLEVTSVSRLMSHGHPRGLYGISWSKSARACTFLDYPRRCTHTRVHCRVISRAHVTRRRVSRVRERLSAVDCMMDASGLT